MQKRDWQAKQREARASLESECIWDWGRESKGWFMNSQRERLGGWHGKLELWVVGRLRNKSEQKSHIWKLIVTVTCWFSLKPFQVSSCLRPTLQTPAVTHILLHNCRANPSWRRVGRCVQLRPVVLEDWSFPNTRNWARQFYLCIASLWEQRKPNTHTHTQAILTSNSAFTMSAGVLLVHSTDLESSLSKIILLFRFYLRHTHQLDGPRQSVPHERANSKPGFWQW